MPKYAREVAGGRFSVYLKFYKIKSRKRCEDLLIEANKNKFEQRVWGQCNLYQDRKS